MNPVRHPNLTLLLISMVLLCAPGSILAQQASAQQTAAALAKAQGLLRRLGEEKAKLQTENAMLKVELAGLEKRAKSVERKAAEEAQNLNAELKASQQQLKSTSGSLQRSEQRLEKTTERLVEVVEKYKAQTQALAQANAEGDALAAERTELKAALENAEKKNLALFDANIEILALYKNKSPLSSLLQKDLVTGIKNVRIESQIEKYKYEMYKNLQQKNSAQGREITAAKLP